MAEIHGTCGEEFVGVREALARNLDSGADVGSSAAVFIDGEPVVDIWGGYFDEARTRPWERDTIVNSFSTTKTMTALSALILADRGELDLDAPVVKYWPEFAAAGKDEVKVRHLLHHTSGLPGWTEPVTVADILDWEKATTLLARQAPWWEPGTAIGYQSLTMGPLVGEVIRRATGKTLKAFFAEEVAGPLGADYHIGAPPEADDRVSLMIQSGPPRPKTDPNSIMDRVFFNPYVFPQDSHTIAWRRGDLGGSNGHGNARSVGMVQSVLACGGEARGVRLLSRAGCERALEAHPVGMDQVLGFPVQWGIGYAVGGPTVQALYGNRFDGRRIAYWGGSGGSFVINDLDRRVTVAYQHRDGQLSGQELRRGSHPVPGRAGDRVPTLRQVAATPNHGPESPPAVVVGPLGNPQPVPHHPAQPDAGGLRLATWAGFPYLERTDPRPLHGLLAVHEGSFPGR